MIKKILVVLFPKTMIRRGIKKKRRKQDQIIKKLEEGFEWGEYKASKYFPVFKE